jgi:hypothetical protein
MVPFNAIMVTFAPMSILILVASSAAFIGQVAAQAQRCDPKSIFYASSELFNTDLALIQAAEVQYWPGNRWWCYEKVHWSEFLQHYCYLRTSEMGGLCQCVHPSPALGMKRNKASIQGILTVKKLKN